MAKHSLDEIFWGLNFRKQKSEEVTRSEFLRKIPFFEGLSAKQLKILGQNLHERKYEEGEYLFEINHPGAALFIVAQGEVNVETSSHHETAQVLAVIKHGEFVGELALLDDSPRSASARAAKPSLAYALFRSDLNDLATTEPEIACQVFKNLASIIGERLKATNRYVKVSGKVA